MILTREPRNFMDVVNWNTLEAPGVIGCVDGSFIAETAVSIQHLNSDTYSPRKGDAS